MLKEKQTRFITQQIVEDSFNRIKASNAEIKIWTLDIGAKALAEMSPPLFRIMFSAAPHFMRGSLTASSATLPEASRRSC